MNTFNAAMILAGAAVIGLTVCSGRMESRAGNSSDNLSGPDVDVPHEHFAIENAAKLDKGEASAAYKSLIEVMARGYGASAEPAARRYLDWRRFNDAPYPSAAHGNRYVNNYANFKAATAGYGQPGSVMPRGAVIVKDSFTASEAGRFWPGALFIMEKLAHDASPETGDWRYVMIMPDGSTFGDSRLDSPRMTFCHDCHAERAGDDYLFFVPKDAAALPTPKSPTASAP
ncbi:MAG: cytochrome P460 family protein [Rhodospirillales bacterium]|nr:cytochrome P460 family protein [Rhodospirillales bacterium]